MRTEPKSYPSEQLRALGSLDAIRAFHASEKHAGGIMSCFPCYCAVVSLYRKEFYGVMSEAARNWLPASSLYGEAFSEFSRCIFAERIGVEL